MATGGASPGRQPQPLPRPDPVVPTWRKGLVPPKKQPRTRVDPQSGLLSCNLPGGPPLEPRSDWPLPESPTPWWGDHRLDEEDGALKVAPQLFCILNTLTGQEQVIEVHRSQGLLQGALPWNAHARGYSWRYGGAPLCPDGPPPSPDPNPGPDDSPPTILLYFADDFVEE